jgi:hypothetical protein
LYRYDTENAPRCTALLSATLTAGTSRLIDLAMVDPVTIEIDAEEPEYVSEGWSNLGGGNDATKGKKQKIDDAMDVAGAAMATGEELAKADVKQMVMRMPEQLRHTAVEVPVKARLAVGLYMLNPVKSQLNLAESFESSLPVARKALSFFQPLKPIKRSPGFSKFCFRIELVPLHCGACGFTRRVDAGRGSQGYGFLFVVRVRRVPLPRLVVARRGGAVPVESS